MLRSTSDGDLAEDADLLLDVSGFPGTPLHGLALEVICPSTFSGNSPTLDILVSASSTSTPSSATQLIAASPQLTASNTPCNIYIPFVTDKAWVEVSLDTTGVCSGSTAPSFGIVIIGVVENVGLTWAR
jgi:hypothetical protein